MPGREEEGAMMCHLCDDVTNRDRIRRLEAEVERLKEELAIAEHCCASRRKLHEAERAVNHELLSASEMHPVFKAEYARMKYARMKAELKARP